MCSNTITNTRMYSGSTTCLLHSRFKYSTPLSTPAFTGEFKSGSSQPRCFKSDPPNRGVYRFLPTYTFAPVLVAPPWRLCLGRLTSQGMADVPEFRPTNSQGSANDPRSSLSNKLYTQLPQGIEWMDS